MPASFPKLGKGYRYFAWLFILAAGATLAVVASSLYGRAEITVTAAQTRASGEYLVTIQDLPFDSPVSDPTVVPGKIMEQTVERTGTFPATGTTPVSGDTVGEVTLVNTTARSQTLVATTRLLTPDQVLLRLKDRVVVPANGRVTATVYPDQPAEFKQLAPTKLTIPGLAANLQRDIYAESLVTLPVAASLIATVVEQDLSAAQAAVTKQVKEQAAAAFDAALSERERLYTKLVYHEIVNSSADAGAGDQQQEFTVRQQLKVVSVAFDEARLANVVRRHLTEQLPFTHELLDVDPASLRYDTERYDPVRKEVILKVYAEGSSGLKATSPLLNPAALTGLTKEQISSYFKRYPEIKSVEVRFSPESLRRSPRSSSRIIFTVR